MKSFGVLFTTLLLWVCLSGCGALPVYRQNEYSITPQGSSGATTMTKHKSLDHRMFEVSLPGGWVETSYSSIPEASVAKYSNAELDATMTVSFLLFSGSPMDILTAERDRLEAKQWKVVVVDDDESDGMVALVAESTTHSTIVRVVRSPDCPKGSPSCAVIFAGRWVKGHAEDASLSCDLIEASYKQLP